MDTLPVEILHNIFIQRDLHDRRTCLTVCRNLYSVLNNMSLFYSFRITSEEQFQTFMEAFKKSSVHAAQVEEIFIDRPTHFGFIQRNIFVVLPNVRNISVEPPVNKKFQGYLYTRSIANSTPKLGYLSDWGVCALVSQILSLNLASQLHTLNMDFVNHRSCEAIIFQMNDLPVLQKLFIRRASINILNIEHLHSSIPSIRNICLVDVCILNCEMPSNVVPATYITNLKFLRPRYEDADTCAQMYRYMTKKYTNLATIDYWDAACRDANNDRFDPYQRRNIYLNGLREFLRVLASKQSQLFIHSWPRELDVFNALDAGNCELNFVSFVDCESTVNLQNLVQSNQSEFITDIFMMNTSIDALLPFVNMASLTTLKINCLKNYSKPLHLVDCLAGCPPTLRTLVLRDDVVLPAVFPQPLPSIQELYLGVTNIIGILGDLVSHCFPNLYDLTLRGTVRESVYIAFRNPHFQVADFTMNRNRNNLDLQYGLYFKSATMNNAMYYSCNRSETTQVVSEAVRNNPVIFVECFTEEAAGMPQRDNRPLPDNPNRKGKCSLRLY